MRRTLVILLFLAGLAITPLRAQGTDAAQEYVSAFLLSRKAEELEASGDFRGAMRNFRNAADTLSHLKQSAPDYQPEMRDWRLAQTQKAIDRVQGKMGPDSGGAPASNSAPLGTPDDVAGGAGVLPPLAPMPGDTQPTRNTGAKPPKTPRHPVAAANSGSDDPIEKIKSQIAELTSQLDDTKQQLETERTENSKLHDQLATAVKQRALAETEKKKSNDLAELYQSKVLDLKSKGDNNGSHAKELEGQLAAAKKANDDREAELHAAEERIDQLLSRSRAVAKKAGEAGTLPGEVKTLQSKLEAEQKSKADLADKLAGVTKERDDARTEITRLKTLNKETDKLMTENATLSKKLGDAQKQLLALTAEGPKKDQEITDLRKEVQDVQKQLAASQDKNATMQGEMTALQKKVDEYTKQIAQYKTDKNASAADRVKMEEENKMLQGIVLRAIQEDANRAQRRKLVQMEMDRQNIQSTALIKQISYLTQPVVHISKEEGRLFKKPKVDIEDPNTIVVIRGGGGDSAATPEKPDPKPDPAPDKLPEVDAKAAGNPTPAAPDPAPAAPGTPPTPPPDNSAKPENAPTDLPKKSADVPAPTPPADATPPVAPIPPDSKPGKPDDMAKLANPKPTLPEKLPSNDNTAPDVSTNSASSAASHQLSADVKPIAEQAKQMFDHEKYPDAEKLYDKALAIAPTNMYLLSNKAVVQFRMGKLKQAEETFRKAIAIAPEDHFCWGTLGIVQYSQGKYDDAVNSLTKSLAINPKNPTAHNYLGITAAQKGWLEAAEKELITATQLDPKYADAWFNLAVTHTLKQPPNKTEARIAYKKALELGADADPAMEQSLK